MADPENGDRGDLTSEQREVLAYRSSMADPENIDRGDLTSEQREVLAYRRRVINTLFPEHVEANTNPNMGDEDRHSLASSDSSIRSEIGNSSKLTAVFLLVNSALGTGLLNIPKAFDEAGGIRVALIVELLLVGCVCLGLLILCLFSRDGNSATLQEIVADMLGHKLSIICSLLIALYSFGTCVSFLIIIGDQYDRIFMSLVGPTFCHHWYLNRVFTIYITSLIFILPMCYSRKIDFLKYASSLGVLAIIYVIGLVVFQYYTGGFVPGPIKTDPGRWTDVFNVVPVICFAYQCHVSLVPTYHCMADRSLSSITWVVIATLLLCAAAYSLTGVYGYLTFGGSVSSDVLEDYGGTNIAVLAGVAAIAVKSITAYPLMLFCGRQAAIDVYRSLITEDPLRELGRRVFSSTIWFILTVAIAINVSDIGIVIDLLGCLAAVFIFIIPGLCVVQDILKVNQGHQEMQSRLTAFAAILFTALGAFIFGFVLMQTLEKLEANETSPPLCLWQY